MDKSKHKPGKKPDKNNAKEAQTSLVSDVKNLKENLKIKEILRTVKLNSSMRLKSPQHSKVINSKDLIQNEESFDDAVMEIHDNNSEESPSATNPNVLTTIPNLEFETENYVLQNEEINEAVYKEVNSEKDDILLSNPSINNFNEFTELENAVQEEIKSDASDAPLPNLNSDIVNFKVRERKLSLDQTILSRSTGLSQSEIDLHSISKLPLERKSSFFRKKMDSFLRNTTEIFKRQSQSGKSQTVQRRGSKSISLQSLTDKSAINGPCNGNPLHNLQELTGSATSLSTMARSSSLASSICPEETEHDSPAGSQRDLYAAQPLCNCTSNSVTNLKEACVQESLLNSRAISMSTGLDAPQGRLRRKASKSNRVTWVASEGVTNYFKRLMQDEKSRGMQMCPSYQDFSSIPENEHHGPTKDSKGRRLSYQRAVSGEDPVSPVRYYDSAQRRKNTIPEHQMKKTAFEKKLESFSKYGIPPLRTPTIMLPKSMEDVLQWTQDKSLQIFCDEISKSPEEVGCQAVTWELVATEAGYIQNLRFLVNVFLAAAQGLQDCGFLSQINLQQLFRNLPELLDASLSFWMETFYPMLLETKENGKPLDPKMLYYGFTNFRDFFQPYETYLISQNQALNYLRSLTEDHDFTKYLTWCYAQGHKRLQLLDMLVTPMQRLTKYELILNRISGCLKEESEKAQIDSMASSVKSFVVDINRLIRQREELEKLDQASKIIEAYDIESKDEDTDRYFRMNAQLNLKTSMIGCAEDVNRSLIFDGDLKFRDGSKEQEVHVFLFTDFLLICKKLPKGSTSPYKMIRPKVKIDTLHIYPKFNKTTMEITGIINVVVDDFHSSSYSFTLSESSKEEKPPQTHKTTGLQLWMNKIKEAKICYELSIFFSTHLKRQLLAMEMDPAEIVVVTGNTASSKLMKLFPDELCIDKEARERVAATLHGKTSINAPVILSPTDSFDISLAILSGDLISAIAWRNPIARFFSDGKAQIPRPSKSITADEPLPGPSNLVYQPGVCVEHVIAVHHPEEGICGHLIQLPAIHEPTIPAIVIEEPLIQPPLEVLEPVPEIPEILVIDSQQPITEQPKTQEPIPVAIAVPIAAPCSLMPGVDETSTKRVRMSRSSLRVQRGPRAKSVQSARNCYVGPYAQRSKSVQSYYRIQNVERAQKLDSIQVSLSPARSGGQDFYRPRASSAGTSTFVHRRGKTITSIKSLPDLTGERAGRRPDSPRPQMNTNMPITSKREPFQVYNFKSDHQQQKLSSGGVSYTLPKTRRSYIKGFSYSPVRPSFSKVGHAKSQGYLAAEPHTSYKSRSTSTIPVPETIPDNRAKLAISSFFSRSSWQSKLGFQQSKSFQTLVKRIRNSLVNRITTSNSTEVPDSGNSGSTDGSDPITSSAIDGVTSIETFYDTSDDKACGSSVQKTSTTTNSQDAKTSLDFESILTEDTASTVPIGELYEQNSKIQLSMQGTDKDANENKPSDIGLPTLAVPPTRRNTGTDHDGVAQVNETGDIEEQRRDEEVTLT